jgi:hypothetical protein
MAASHGGEGFHCEVNAKGGHLEIPMNMPADMQACRGHVQVQVPQLVIPKGKARPAIFEVERINTASVLPTAFAGIGILTCMFSNLAIQCKQLTG